MTYEQALTTAILALSGVIVSLAIYISQIHKKQIKNQNDNSEQLREINVEMIQAMTRVAIAVENNTKVVDKISAKR